MALIDNLISYYKLDDTDDTNAVDSHGDNHGTQEDGVTDEAAGKIGTAFSFDGSNDHVRIANGSSLQFGTGSFTISVWIYPETAGNVRIINNRGTGAGGTTAGWQFKIRDVAGQWQFNDAGIDDATGNYKTCNGCGSNYDYNDWYHVVMMYEADVELRFYVNGSLDGIAPVGSYGSISNSLPTAIGAAISANGVEGTHTQWFDGRIDEIGVWSRALSPGEITALWNSGDGFAYPFGVSSSSSSSSFSSSSSSSSFSSCSSSSSSSFSSSSSSSSFSSSSSSCSSSFSSSSSSSSFSSSSCSSSFSSSSSSSSFSSSSSSSSFSSSSSSSSSSFSSSSSSSSSSFSSSSSSSSSSFSSSSSSSSFSSSSSSSSSSFSSSSSSSSFSSSSSSSSSSFSSSSSSSSSSFSSSSSSSSFSLSSSSSSLLSSSSSSSLSSSSSSSSFSSSSSSSSSSLSSSSGSCSLDPTKSYSRGDYLNLPADDSGLETPFVCIEYPKVAIDDNIYVQQCARDTLDPYGVFVWKDKHSNNTDVIVSTCILKTSRAPSVNTVYLQIYNRNSGVWETLDSNDAIAADTEFTLSGMQTTNLTYYYDGSFWAIHRIYQKVE